MSDSQMEAVMTAAADLPVEKRGVFLERLAARLRLRDPRRPLSGVELNDAMRDAMTGAGLQFADLSSMAHKDAVTERELSAERALRRLQYTESTFPWDRTYL